MRVAVIGLGSMGKRRIRLIRKYSEAIEIIGVDTNEERRKTCEKEYGIEVDSSLTNAVDKTYIDCAFVCTPPISHSEIITQCLDKGLHVFTELNLVADGYAKNMALAKLKNLVLFMSSTFLYKDEVKYIKNLIHKAKHVLNYTYHVGQYLPDWHSWDNYKNFFAGDKRTNGCREIFAIELPWLSDVFGEIIKVEVIKSKMSSLDINYADNYLALVQHSSGCKGALAVDVVSRKAVRNLEVFGEELHIQWDGSPGGLFVYDYEAKKDNNIQLYEEIDQLDNYSSFIVENPYMNEVQTFFGAVKGQMAQIYTFEEDWNIIKLIDTIES